MRALDELVAQERSNRAGEFVSLAKLLLKANGDRSAASGLAETDKAPERVRRILKNVVPAGTTGNLGGLVDLQVVSSGFVDALRNLGVFDRMLGSMVRVPLDEPNVRATTVTATGYGVTEATAKPISRIELGSEALGKYKADCIIVITEEIANSASGAASALIARELRNGVVASTDDVFISALFLTVTAPVASSGGTAANVLTDAATLLAAVNTGSASKLFWVMSSGTAKSLSAKATTTGARAFPELSPNGGELVGVPVLVSDHLPVTSPAGVVLLVDASGIAADSEGVVLDGARHASLQMDNAPTMTAGGIGSPDAPTETTVINLWQTNARALKASRYFGFKVFRADAVQALTGVAW